MAGTSVISPVQRRGTYKQQKDAEILQFDCFPSNLYLAELTVSIAVLVASEPISKMR